MSDDRDAPIRGGAPGYLMSAGPEMTGVSPDLAQVASLTLEAAIPGLADAASVFVLEHWLRGGDPVSQAADANVAVRRLGTGFARAGCLVPDAAFPPGEVLAFAADSPYVRCMRDRAPVLSAQPHGGTLERMKPGARQVAARYGSFLAAPVIAQGIVIGFLSLARTAGAPAFDSSATETAAHLAAQAGIGMASSLTLLRHRSAADLPQPRQPAASRCEWPQIDIAGRCVPAAGYHVGGDWYDIVRLPAGRTGLIVGDVMGHGAPAATVMAQLSTAAYALADLNLSPAQVLRQLNRTAVAFPRTTFATCAYVIIDPQNQECVIATAGHVPPVLATPAGTTLIPRLPGGQALGITHASYDQTRVNLPAGTVLALYTDGLVETRTRPFDQGIAELRTILARSHQHLEATCDDLIASLGGSHEDDITVVLATITQPSARESDGCAG